MLIYKSSRLKDSAPTMLPNLNGCVTISFISAKGPSHLPERKNQEFTIAVAAAFILASIISHTLLLPALEVTSQPVFLQRKGGSHTAQGSFCVLQTPHSFLEEILLSWDSSQVDTNRSLYRKKHSLTKDLETNFEIHLPVHPILGSRLYFHEIGASLILREVIGVPLSDVHFRNTCFCSGVFFIKFGWSFHEKKKAMWGCEKAKFWARVWSHNQVWWHVSVIPAS